MRCIKYPFETFRLQHYRLYYMYNTIHYSDIIGRYHVMYYNLSVVYLCPLLYNRKLRLDLQLAPCSILYGTIHLGSDFFTKPVVWNEPSIPHDSVQCRCSAPNHRPTKRKDGRILSLATRTNVFSKRRFERFQIVFTVCTLLCCESTITIKLSDVCAWRHRKRNFKI